MNSRVREVDFDRIETFGNSTIQHGAYNDRVYIMDLAPEDYPHILQEFDELCTAQGYTKAFAVVPETLAEGFKEHGFRTEARVPGLFRGKDAGMFFAKYYSDERRKAPIRELQKLHQVVDIRTPAAPAPLPMLPEGFALSMMQEQDIREMCRLYAAVFPRYPFPIQDADFIRETMAGKTRFFGIRVHGRLVALASAELNRRAAATEMTDFAVHPEYRGNRLGLHLLAALEEDARQRGIITAYTIARLNSIGMNLVFHRTGYTFGGTLINNTRIATGIESMNVWYKTLEN